MDILRVGGDGDEPGHDARPRAADEAAARHLPGQRAVPEVGPRRLRDHHHGRHGSHAHTRRLPSAQVCTFEPFNTDMICTTYRSLKKYPIVPEKIYLISGITFTLYLVTFI